MIVDAEGRRRGEDYSFSFLATHFTHTCQGLPILQSHFCFCNALGYQLPVSSNVIHFLFAAKTPFDHFVSLSVDNYLAMEVACTLVCPRANQEVVITHPDGNETQKCEKCEGDCPKGGDHCVFVATSAFGYNTLFTYTQ